MSAFRMKLSQFKSRFLLVTLLQLLIHANNAVARGGYSNGCSGTSNECGGGAVMGFSLIAFIAIYFIVLGKHPSKSCPSFLLTLFFAGISTVLAFITAAILSSIIGLSLSLAWLVGGIICFVSFAYLLKESIIK